MSELVNAKTRKAVNAAADADATVRVRLEQMRTAHCFSPVEYRRPPEFWTVQATFGKTGFEVADESGLTINAQVWDFLILADALPGIEPEPGDVIAANGRRYEVVNLGGEGCWRWSDPYRETYRIHTKDIGSDT
jgi:hypothetical protein